MGTKKSDYAKRKATKAASTPVSDGLPENDQEEPPGHSHDLSKAPQVDEGHSDPDSLWAPIVVPTLKLKLKKPEKSRREPLH